MRALCIDFETANRFAGSICSVGIALIENGEIIDTKHWLVRPHEDYGYFDYFNVLIHGIDEHDVIDAPEFDVVYEQLKPLFEQSIVVAHNAAFDMSALRHVLDLYGIKYPKLDYLCTYKTAQKTWMGLENYKLDTVCQFLNHDFKHHDAQEDAVASGKVLLSALTEKGLTSVGELASTIGMQLGKLYDGGYEPCSVSRSRKSRINNR